MPPRKKATADGQGGTSTAPPAKKKPAGASKRKKAADTAGSDDEPAKPQKKPRKSLKDTKDARETSVEVVEAKSEDITIPWATAAYHSLTDGVLSCIEEDNGIRCGLGFDPQGALVVRGVPQAALHRKIAEKTVLQHPEFKNMELKKAGQAVKNRLDKLKKLYFSNKNQLNDTGEGLLPLDDGDGQLPDGHEHKNLYEQILADFPWYWRMRCLLNRSPIYDRSAVVHSGSELDLGFMLPKTTTDKSSGSGNTPVELSDSDGASEASDGDAEVDVKPSVKGGTATSSAGTRAASAPVKSRTRATPMEQLSANLDRSEQRRAEQLQAIIKAKEKADERKSEAKADTQLRLAKLKYEAKAQQAQAQRDHEFRMAQLQLGIHPSQLALPPAGEPSGLSPLPAFPPPTAASSLPSVPSQLDLALSGANSSPLSSSFTPLPSSIPSAASTPSSFGFGLDDPTH
ncbi:hypothetical protein AURDEDRAFT_170891 [Auricularia subglabra TFB-10046 SS5]|nr:hypothetical protein AURDEDRAFT_170891 [Auricularia subglabra TFB-10046 SS5]